MNGMSAGSVVCSRQVHMELVVAALLIRTKGFSSDPLRPLLSESASPWILQRLLPYMFCRRTFEICMYWISIAYSVVQPVFRLPQLIVIVTIMDQGFRAKVHGVSYACCRL
jgi:hypothetical protein